MDGAVLLVEGRSDEAAVRSLAATIGLPLAPGAVIQMDGITNLRHHLAHLDAPPSRRVGVLHDAGEAAHVRMVIGEQQIQPATFECVADLEDELIRAVGLERAEDVVVRAGDEAAWHTILRQPFHRDRPRDQVLRRFFGAGSGRKQQYAALLAAELDEGTAPPPLVAAVRHAASA